MDYRGLNSATKMDDMLDSLSEACVFSTLDLASKFYQVEVEGEDHIKSFPKPTDLKSLRLLFRPYFLLQKVHTRILCCCKSIV